MGSAFIRTKHFLKNRGGTPWHQDQTFWPLDTTKTVTLWMPLVDLSDQCGSMTFVSGSQRLGWINQDEGISDSSEAYFSELISWRGWARASYGAMKAGDATFHAGWTLHWAPSNTTSTMREIMTVIYMADDTRILEPDSNARRDGLMKCLPGCKPGQLAASPINPITYHRD